MYYEIMKKFSDLMNKSRITSPDQREGEINRKETIQHQRKTKV